MKSIVSKWLKTHSKDFYVEEIQKLVGWLVGWIFMAYQPLKVI